MPLSSSWQTLPRCGFPLRADSAASHIAWQVLEFAKKPEMSFEEWTNRQEKFQSFFGPGVIASLQETKQVHLWHAILWLDTQTDSARSVLYSVARTDVENIAEVSTRPTTRASWFAQASWSAAGCGRHPGVRRQRGGARRCPAEGCPAAPHPWIQTSQSAVNCCPPCSQSSVRFATAILMLRTATNCRSMVVVVAV